MFGIRRYLKLQMLRLSWRRANQHNSTIPNCLFGMEQVTVGIKSYGELNIDLGTNPNRKVTIGNYCSIASGVWFLVNPHNYHFFSTWSWQRSVFNEYDYSWEAKTSIVVKDDVWIGRGALVLGGVTLGQGCVVGANSCVTRDVPPYGIYAGTRLIGFRFPEEICARLQEIDFSKIDDSVIDRLRGWHKTEITSENISALLAILPKKEVGE